WCRLLGMALEGAVDTSGIEPAAAVEVLRTAFAMGVENGVHLLDPAFAGLDDLGVARVLAAAIKDQNYDIIFAGKHAIDYDRGQVGPALAELLNMPHVGAVTGIEWAADYKSSTVRRRIEVAEEVVQVQLP